MPGQAFPKKRLNADCGTEMYLYGKIATVFEINKSILSAPAF
jgi:hypothetical protein